MNWFGQDNRLVKSKSDPDPAHNAIITTAPETTRIAKSVIRMMQHDPHLLAQVRERCVQLGDVGERAIRCVGTGSNRVETPEDGRDRRQHAACQPSVCARQVMGTVQKTVHCCSLLK